MKNQLTLTALVLCATLLAGTSWAGPCANGANPGPQVDCRGANLVEVNLNRANLQGVNLYRANLQKANLLGANLRGANLDGADLRGADLRWANLQEANLIGANMLRTRVGRHGGSLPWTNLDFAIWVDGRKCLEGSYGVCR